MIIINGAPNVSDDLTAISGQITIVEGKVDAVDDFIDAEVAAIKAKTDNLPSDPADQSLLMAEFGQVEYHLHNKERWFGDAAAPEAGVNEADEASLTTFQLDSGNNDWGTAICILGTGDTPVAVGKTYFDLHRILVTATERTAEPYLVRIAWGLTEADALTAGNYTTIAIYPTTTIRSAPYEIKCSRIGVGTKVWANCKCANNTGTLNFLFGIHEYDA